VAEFALHPRLAADCHRLGRFELCLLLMMNDAHYPWFILVPQREGMREIYELTEADQLLLLRESVVLSKSLKTAFGGDKLNLAALGNVVPQLHLHHIVRHAGDPAWPAPVWGRHPPQPYSPVAATDRRDTLLALLPPAFAPDYAPPA